MDLQLAGEVGSNASWLCALHFNLKRQKWKQTSKKCWGMESQRGEELSVFPAVVVPWRHLGQNSASTKAKKNLKWFFFSSPCSPSLCQKLQIWDTAGQERFRSITQSYYRSANALILTYDITCEESFRCLPEWLREIEQYASNKVITVLVGKSGASLAGWCSDGGHLVTDGGVGGRKKWYLRDVEVQEAQTGANKAEL